MSVYTKPMNTEMIDGFAKAGISQPLSCTVMDIEGKEQVFVNEKQSALALPELDLDNGKFEKCHVVVFPTVTAKAMCWEFKCTRYGCRWRPVPCKK